MVFVRGQAQDFDTWAQFGNRGWSYAEVLPFFKRMESYAGEGDDAFRGRDGPLRVTNPKPRDPLFATIIKAAAQVGIRHNPDYNGASQEGIAMSQATIAGGRRMSTARCYLDPVRNRRNLHIETPAMLMPAHESCGNSWVPPRSSSSFPMASRSIIWSAANSIWLSARPTICCVSAKNETTLSASLWVTTAPVKTCCLSAGLRRPDRISKRDLRFIIRSPTALWLIRLEPMPT